MIYHNSSQSYARPGVTIGVRKPFVRRNVRRNVRKVVEGSLFWKSLGRVAAVVCGSAFVVNLIFGLYMTHLGKAAARIAAYQHELIDGNIALRAERARIMAPEAIKAAAGKKLSLYSPQENQHFVFNVRRGRFDKM